MERAETASRVPMAMNMTEGPLNTASVRELYFIAPMIGHVRVRGHELQVGRDWSQQLPNYHMAGRVEQDFCAESCDIYRTFCAGLFSK